MDEREAFLTGVDFLIQRGKEIDRDTLYTVFGTDNYGLVKVCLEALGEHDRIRQLDKYVKVDSAYRQHQPWTGIEDDLLVASCMDNELSDLALLMGRSEGAVFAKLEGLKDDKRVGKERIRYFRGKISEQEQSSAITAQEIKILKENYKHMDLNKLGDMMGYKPWKALQKLQVLAKTQEGEWDSQRIRDMAAKLRKYYRDRKKEWSDEDVDVLRKTYSDSSYAKLVYMFGKKHPPILERLRKLYNEDPDSWKGEIINQLEKEASDLDSEISGKYRAVETVKEAKGS